MIIDHSFLANIAMRRAINSPRNPKTKTLAMESDDAWLGMAFEYTYELYSILKFFGDPNSDNEPTCHFCLDSADGEYYRHDILKQYCEQNTYWYTHPEGVVAILDTKAVLCYYEGDRMLIKTLKVSELPWEDMDDLNVDDIAEAYPESVRLAKDKVFMSYKPTRDAAPLTGVTGDMWREKRDALGKNFAAFLEDKYYQAPGMEADDLAAALVQKLVSTTAEDIVLVTADTDWDQLRLVDRTRVHTYLWTGKRWAGSWDDDYPHPDPEADRYIKLVSGDTTDGIGGIFLAEGASQRVGKAGAIKLVTSGEIPTHMDRYYPDVVERNFSLIDLLVPHNEAIAHVEKVQTERQEFIDATWEDFGIDKTTAAIIDKSGARYARGKATFE